MNKRKLYKIAGIGSIITVAGTTAVAFALVVNKNKGVSVGTVNNNTIGTSPTTGTSGGKFEQTYIGNIFPTLNASELYEELRIENGTAVLTDQLLASVVNSIIKDSKYINTEGLYWDYSYDNANELRVTFNWPVNGVNNLETYKVNLFIDKTYNTQIANIEKLK